MDAVSSREMRAAATDAMAARLAEVRARMKRARIDGFIVPRSDAHQGEYVPPSDERLAWLTGFHGSAGLAIVMADRAALFVDGRYTLQARNEVDTRAFAIHHLTGRPPDAWLAGNAARGARIGFDPWLMTKGALVRYERACERVGARLKAVARNPIDGAWRDRPAPPCTPVIPLALRFAGRPARDKRRDIAARLAAEGVDAAVLVAPDSINWLLNIRGHDLEFSPLSLAFAVIHRDRRVDLMIDAAKLGKAARRHLGPEVRVHPEEGFGAVLDRLGARGRTVLADPAGTPVWITRRLARAGATMREGSDPCALPKAIKNRVELRGIRDAHRRDGAALSTFLAWLAATAPKGGLSEMDAAARIDGLRAENTHFLGLSFPTIAGSGPNGAIVHYRVNERTNRRLSPGDVFLVDSGAQYLDGTTDVTRTVWIGGGRAKAKKTVTEAFTRVLKGHIALARQRFPAGTRGGQLDVLARRFLWEAGLEYDHGTGHGVGHALNVHEGPQRISQVMGGAALEPGMVLSNEPGFYASGGFGIRIENLMVVRDDGKGAGGRAMRAFEPLTLAPIERALIDRRLLTAEERAWLDAYHARVLKEIGPRVDAKTRAWLKRATRPI